MSKRVYNVTRQAAVRIVITECKEKDTRNTRVGGGISFWSDAWQCTPSYGDNRKD